MAFDPPLTAPEVERALNRQYRRLEPIFVGGQGAVFRATPSNNRASVALKIYFPEQVTERADREVQALSRLSSEFIVRFHENGRVAIRGEQCIYVATDFIEGNVLAQLLRRGPLSLRSTLIIGRDISKALADLWKLRIVHRDVKPENIMMASDGRSILIDLGVARHLSLATLTAHGATWGTLGYMAPEHARARRQLTCKADVFSLGIVLQQCISGKHPTSGRQDILNLGGPPTASLGVTLPDAFVELVDAMVAREPQRRPLPEEISDLLTTMLTLEV